MVNKQDSDSPVVGIYARVSMPKQKSIPSQVEQCRAECQRRGWQPRYILKDQGLSAKTEDRPGYQRLLDLIGDRRVDVVVVWKMDRLVRSMRHFVDFTSLLEECDVDLVSLTEQIDTSSAFGRFNFRNIASVAELERELIGERSKLGRYRMAVDGRWPNKFPPFGYSLDEKHNLSVNREEARIVQQIFSWYTNGVPITEITRRLSQRGITGRRGKPMGVSTIHAMVRSPIYVGRLQIMEISHPRPDLRLIHDRTFERVKERNGRRCQDAGVDRRRQTAMDNVLADYLDYLDAQEELSPVDSS